MTIIRHHPYNYYVYALATSKPTYMTRFTDQRYGYVFYVGKGVGVRMHMHEEYARLGYEDPKSVFIRELWDLGGVVRKRMVFSSPIEKEAFQFEYELIKKIGLDNLLNTHPGQKDWLPRDERIAEHHRRMREREEAEEELAG